MKELTVKSEVEGCKGIGFLGLTIDLLAHAFCRAGLTSTRVMSVQNIHTVNALSPTFTMTEIREWRRFCRDRLVSVPCRPYQGQ